MTTPDFSKMKLDFSQFHPLDHSIWRCNGFPGGRRRHLKYRWEFQWETRVRAWLLCPFGKHDWVRWHPGPGNPDPDQPVVTACANCYKEKA